MCCSPNVEHRAAGATAGATRHAAHHEKPEADEEQNGAERPEERRVVGGFRVVYLTFEHAFLTPVFYLVLDFVGRRDIGFNLCLDAFPGFEL